MSGDRIGLFSCAVPSASRTCFDSAPKIVLEEVSRGENDLVLSVISEIELPICRDKVGVIVSSAQRECAVRIPEYRHTRRIYEAPELSYIAYRRLSNRVLQYREPVVQVDDEIPDK